MKTRRELQVFDLLRKNPMTSQQAIAKRLGISRSAVAGHIMKLTDKGFIKGRGYVISDAPFVIAIGGANMDIHGKPAGALSPHDSNPGTVHTSPGGVARNIAENLARLGTECRLLSAVGNDEYGHALMQSCRDAGIDVQHVQQFDAAQTSTYLSVLDGAGDMHIAINDMAIMENLGPEQLRPQASMLKAASLIILDANLREDALAWLTSTLADKMIFADTVSAAKAKKMESCLSTIHTLKMSRTEAETLSGLKTRTQAELRKLSAWVHQQGVAELFVTLGEDGVFYSDGKIHGIEKPQRKRRSLRSTGGAGDAFLSGIAYSRLQDWPLRKSIRFALAVADVTLSERASTSPILSLAAVNRVYKELHAA